MQQFSCPASPSLHVSAVHGRRQVRVYLDKIVPLYASISRVNEMLIIN
jgi:hypothetical protein